MTGPGHGRIRAFAMEGNSEDASLRAPGRNERRSAGHGKAARTTMPRAKPLRLKPRRNIPTVAGSSRDGRSVERIWPGKRFSNSKAAKEKIAAWVCGTRDRRRPRPWTAGWNMAEPCTLIEAAQPFSARARRRRLPSAAGPQTLAAAVCTFQPKDVDSLRTPSRHAIALHKSKAMV